MMDRRHFLKSAGFMISGSALFTHVTDVMAAATAGAESKKPNIVFIMTDQQFGDAMSCRMGKRYLNTPAMDSLAENGVFFSRAYTPNPLCMPARNSIFTGRYPHETGVTQNANPQGGRLALEFVFMGTYFRNAGYTTAYTGKWHICLDSNDTQAHGFQILARPKLENPQDDNYDSRISHSAVEFLRQKHQQPFLLVVSLLNPHNICEWARRLAGRQQKLNCGEIGSPPQSDQLPPAPQNLEVPQNESDTMITLRKAYQVPTGSFPVGDFTAETWRQHRWGYYRMIEKVDGEIAGILNALKASGLENDTVVIFTSDHGDCAGAHRFNQKTVFYEESARVPLIISYPGKTPKAVSDRLVNTGVDILPTMLDFAGVQPPAPLKGRSLKPVALGEPVSQWRDYVVVENNMTQTPDVMDGIVPKSKGRMVRTGQFKYCLYQYGQQRESLFDMEHDPLETENLARNPKYHDILLEHRKLLSEFADQYHDTLVAEMLADNIKPRPFPKASEKQKS